MEEVIEMFVGVILSKYYRVVVELIKEVCCESEGDLGSQQGKTFAGLLIPPVRQYERLINRPPD
jgi:hypothetical protein